MVIDDDEMLREVMIETLRDDGYAVVQAGNGKEALEILEQSTPELILVDVMMPVMNGYEFCKRLRKLPNGHNVPVIIMTGQGDVEAIETAFDSGATDFISKPVNWHIIGHRIQYTLRASQAMKEATLNAKLLSDAQRIAKLGNWSWDTGTKQMHVSTAAYRIFGVPHTSPGIFYQMLRSSIDSDDSDAFELAIQQAQGGTPSDVEIQVIPPDGKCRSLHIHVERVPDGGVSQLFGTF